MAYTCPRCHKGKLFRGLISVVENCSACGLSFKEHEQGDGPAFFGVLVVGAVTAIGATIVEIKYAPAYWVHAAIWGPFIVAGSILSLRWGKAMLIAMQYRVKRDDFQG